MHKAFPRPPPPHTHTHTRWFDPKAVFELWDMLAPAIGTMTNAAAAYETLGWLALFAPTHSICRCV